MIIFCMISRWAVPSFAYIPALYLNVCRWLPLRRDRIAMSGNPLHNARAHRTAAFFRSRAGIDHRLPYVAFRAPPPYLLMAPYRHLLRRERRVQFRIPLRRDIRLQRCQVIEPRQHFLPRAIRTAAFARRPVGYRRAIGMPKVAAPPDPPIAAWRNGFRRQR